jgi:hypothetical protein
MAIWDRICYIVCAREVSVEDVSNKSGMLLRLLHSAAHCRTWYVGKGFIDSSGARADVLPRMQRSDTN